tara:strand:- start:5061 stop:5378 length:318 start_codon:yes stop_codon:yes gene_type:complete
MLNAPNIVTSVPKFSDGEVDWARIQLLEKSFKHERETEDDRTLIAKKEANDNRGKTHPVLGKCVANIPARDYFRLIKKYGQDTVHSPEFLRDLKKYEPLLCAHSA